LPKQAFSGLVVEQGGIGAGTVVRVTMAALDAAPSPGLKGWIERMVTPALRRDELRLRAEHMQKKP
jgi:hypothetical protein